MGGSREQKEGLSEVLREGAEGGRESAGRERMEGGWV